MVSEQIGHLVENLVGKFILMELKGTYTEVFTEDCRKVNPIPCPDEVDERPIYCALLSCARQKELCECYELELGETYYFVAVDKNGGVITYKILVTDEGTKILGSMLTLPCRGMER